MNLDRRTPPAPQVPVETRDPNTLVYPGRPRGSSSRKTPAALVFTQTSLPTPGSSLALWEGFKSADLHHLLVMSTRIWDFPLSSYGWVSEIQVDQLWVTWYLQGVFPTVADERSWSWTFPCIDPQGQVRVSYPCSDIPETSRKQHSSEYLEAFGQLVRVSPWMW